QPKRYPWRWFHLILGRILSSAWGQAQYIGYHHASGNSDVDEVILTGSGSSWINSGGLHVGQGDAGLLSVGIGSSVRSDNLYVGVGAAGSLEAAGDVEIDDSVTLGYHSSKLGSASVSGSLEADSITLGRSGTGSLIVEGGGQVGANTITLGSVSVGIGIARVRNSGSVLDSSASLFVAAAGTGALYIENGGRVNSHNTFVGGSGSAGGSGVVNVSDNATRWSNSGDLTIGDNGSGRVSIADGGVSVVGETEIAGNGQLDLNGGYLTTNDFTRRSGSVFNHTAGVLTVNTGVYTPLSGQGIRVSGTDPTVRLFNGATLDTGLAGVIVGFGSGQQGSLEVRGGSRINSSASDIGRSNATGVVLLEGVGSRWDLASGSDLSVGQSGRGTLTVQNGATLVNNAGDIGDSSPGSGEVTIDDATWTNKGDLTVGLFGQGVLTVENGASVSSPNGRLGADGSSKTGAQSDGVVTVTGSDSSWTMNRGNLDVGIRGVGRMDVLHGGEVATANGTLGVLDNSGLRGAGEVTLNYGGSWRNLGMLTVGDAGSGVVGVYGGSALVSYNASIGASAGGDGTVTIAGGDTTWGNSGVLIVGDAGDGELVVISSGVMTTADARVGNSSGGSGVVTVHKNGQWVVQQDLDIGLQGDGEVRIIGGGAVTGVNNTTVGSSGVLTINGGTLESGTILVDGGVAGLHSSNSINDTSRVTVAGGSFDLYDSTETVRSLSVEGGASTLEGGHLDTSLGITLTGSGVLDGHGTVGGDVSNDGHVDGGTGSNWLTFTGDVVGSSDFTGNVAMEGSYRPGSATAEIGFDDLVLGSTHMLYIDLGGTTPDTQYDVINVADALTLAGTLNVASHGGFDPGNGDTFNIFDWGSRIGTFGEVNLPGLSGDLEWNTDDLYTTGEISVTPEPATISLLALGGLAVLRKRRRRA
ncbi:MAG: PEP-CTERM sorting domain-containing protein, partial [Phycisphaerae bacterium]|nr:PEP-CTERM sorting domain-containing protein [Phycisphaerae bacterium]